MKRKIGKVALWFWHLSLLKKLAVIVLILLFGWFVVPKLFGQRTNQPQYQTAQVERGTLVQSISASGTVTSGGSVIVSTNVRGIVQTVYVKRGDSVVQGQQIAAITLDQSSQQQQAAAYASYLSAKNSLNSAKAKMNSLQSALFKANQAFVTDRGVNGPTDQQKADPKYIEENAEWLQAEADYNNQAGVISQTQAALTSASLSMMQTAETITAPSNGTISNLIISRGYQIVNQNTSGTSSSNASNTTTLGTIALEGGQLQASVNLSEIDVTGVRVGQKATLTLDAFPNKTFTGKITAVDISGSVSSGVTTYPATITFDTADASIYPNMGVSAKIITNVKDNVLLIPSSALQTQNGTSTIRLLQNGQVQTADVVTGAASDTQTEIVSGVSTGDTVVTSVTNPLGTTNRTTQASPFSPFGGALRGGGGGAGRFGR